MTVVIFTKHAADALRQISRTDPVSATSILGSIKTVETGGSSELGKTLKRRPDMDDVYSIESGNYRALATVDDPSHLEKLFVVAILSNDKPEGSDLELREVIEASAAE